MGFSESFCTSSRQVVECLSCFSEPLSCFIRCMTSVRKPNFLVSSSQRGIIKCKKGTMSYLVLFFAEGLGRSALRRIACCMAPGVCSSPRLLMPPSPGTAPGGQRRFPGETPLLWVRHEPRPKTCSPERSLFSRSKPEKWWSFWAPFSADAPCS